MTRDSGDAHTLLTIGQLSELTGVPVRTIRFYSDSLPDGRTLLEPALRSPSGYRLYEIEAAARLELIRTLRDLGIDLPTIAKVLARELTVAEVARAQADALEATVRTLRLRQAVLRAVAVRDTDWEELELMNRLTRLDAEGRKRILDEFVDRVFDGIEDEHGTGEAFAAMMRSAFPELPQEPNGRPQAPIDSSLHDALSIMLAAGGREVVVTDGEQPRGIASLETITRELTTPEEAAPPARGERCLW